MVFNIKATPGTDWTPYQVRYCMAEIQVRPVT